jgi:hypothetical protein
MANYYKCCRILVDIPPGGMEMASMDRQHEKKLKEAEKAYNKWKRAFLAGKISKEELKEKLRPYKYELHELNLVKLKEGDIPPREEDNSGGKEEPETVRPVEPVAYPPWRKRSSLTLEEIEDSIDMLSLDSRPSETLQMLYEKRYGEQLSPPENPVVFSIEDDDPEDYDLPGTNIRELPSFEDEGDESEPAELGKPAERKERKSFWKGLRRRNREQA